MNCFYHFRDSKRTIKPVKGKGERVVVAIKKLNNDGSQGHKEWVSEVQFLGVVDHPNLVKLIGYCAMDGERDGKGKGVGEPWFDSNHVCSIRTHCSLAPR
ncbi:probable receptor-like protein kinase at5g47070 [Phtheirospermum japonicum]|uniref:Probable receptor-like protein kinase at5g47070 n=1 Tax=Phtheirospermum japonicum TaxID=374723 RepID=A0A830C2T3_9LAMI|nr:probable receptor-like protein kinase at5g47070 [Phtheirospermum japonicum]